MTNAKNNNRHERRQLAIKLAREMVRKGGLESLSTRKIASKLNCSIGTIYNIFKDTDEMMLYINAATLLDMKDFISNKVYGDYSSNGVNNCGCNCDCSSDCRCGCDHNYRRCCKCDLKSPEMILKNLAKFYILFAKQNYNLWNAIFEASAPKDRVLPDWYEEAIQGLFKLIEEPLFLLIPDQYRVKLSAKIIWASIHGICTLTLGRKLSSGDEDGAYLMADFLIENYVLGFKSKELKCHKSK